jgi:hypothetical protein
MLKSCTCEIQQHSAFTVLTWVPLEKTIVIQLVKKVPTFYETKGFIINLTTVLLLNSVLRQLKPVHILTPYYFKIHFNITLSSTPAVTTQLFPSSFPTKNSHALLICPRHATYPFPPHTVSFDQPNIARWTVQIMRLVIGPFSQNQNHACSSAPSSKAPSTSVGLRFSLWWL